MLRRGDENGKGAAPHVSAMLHRNMKPLIAIKSERRGNPS
jgi:hypothetical protein